MNKKKRRFSDRLIALMEKKNLKDVDISNALNVSKTTVKKWKSHGDIREHHLKELAKFLCVDALVLRYGEERVERAYKSTVDYAAELNPTLKTIRRRETELTAAMLLLKKDLFTCDIITDELYFYPETIKRLRVPSHALPKSMTELILFSEEPQKKSLLDKMERIKRGDDVIDLMYMTIQMPLQGIFCINIVCRVSILRNEFGVPVKAIFVIDQRS